MRWFTKALHSSASQILKAIVAPLVNTLGHRDLLLTSGNKSTSYRNRQPFLARRREQKVAENTSPPGRAASWSRGSSSGPGGPAAGCTPPGGWRWGADSGCCSGPRTRAAPAPRSPASGSGSSSPPPGPPSAWPPPHRPRRSCRAPPPGSARTSAGCWPS